MIAVIHRPYYFPWLGYFAKLVYADVFIVMDDVFFTKRHYIDRVQVINAQGELMWLRLNTGMNFKKRCDEIKIPNTFTVDSVIQRLSSSYSKARYYKTYRDEIQYILETSLKFTNELPKFDIKIVEMLLQLLSIPIPNILFSSQFSYVDEPTERLIHLCEQTSSTGIIMGSGGSVDIHDMSRLSENGMQIFYQDFYSNHPEYYQTRRERLGFAKGLSILDCIFNEGLEFTRSLLMDPVHKPRTIILEGVALAL